LQCDDSYDILQRKWEYNDTVHQLFMGNSGTNYLTATVLLNLLYHEDRRIEISSNDTRKKCVYLNMYLPAVSVHNGLKPGGSLL
jgi:hypothetical protein